MPAIVIFSTIPCSVSGFVVFMLLFKSRFENVQISFKYRDKSFLTSVQIFSYSVLMGYVDVNLSCHLLKKTTTIHFTNKNTAFSS